MFNEMSAGPGVQLPKAVSCRLTVEIFKEVKLALIAEALSNSVLYLTYNLKTMHANWNLRCLSGLLTYSGSCSNSDSNSVQLELKSNPVVSFESCN